MVGAPFTRRRELAQAIGTAEHTSRTNRRAMRTTTTDPDPDAFPLAVAVLDRSCGVQQHHQRRAEGRPRTDGTQQPAPATATTTTSCALAVKDRRVRQGRLRRCHRARGGRASTSVRPRLRAVPQHPERLRHSRRAAALSATTVGRGLRHQVVDRAVAPGRRVRRLRPCSRKPSARAAAVRFEHLSFRPNTTPFTTSSTMSTTSLQASPTARTLQQYGEHTLPSRRRAPQSLRAAHDRRRAHRPDPVRPPWPRARPRIVLPLMLSREEAARSRPGRACFHSRQSRLLWLAGSATATTTARPQALERAPDLARPRRPGARIPTAAGSTTI